ncbi:SHOCT domain-containing protein [Nocardia sp. NPDC051750]|uniref:SHOCT domain-containing protein n=1 Tax=Nocardia sp. NPDC051750 TaxID=3364325 RepID=UPI0037B82DBC
MYWYGHGMNGWAVVLMVVVMVLLTGLITVAVVAIIRTVTISPRFWATSSLPGTNAEHLLADRFARGEIDDEEYRRRLHTLRTGPPPH